MSRCKDCNTLLGDKRSTRCPKCNYEHRSGSNSHFWKRGMPKCVDCGIELKSYTAKRCIPCMAKNMKGKKRSPEIAKKVSDTIKKRMSEGLADKIRVARFGENYKKPVARCINCGVVITRHAQRCKSCSKKGIFSPMVGYVRKKKYSTANMTGANNSNWRGGVTKDRKEYQRMRLKNPRNALRLRVSCLIRARLKAKKHGKSAFDYLPYTFDQLMKSIESKFTVGMGWHNMGEWHIDHIIPDSHFDYITVEDEGFKKSWALENLQPLWATHNLRKGSKLNWRAA